MKIRPVGAELFHADRSTDRHMERRTDLTKLPVASRNFANASKKNGDFLTTVNQKTCICVWV